MSAEMEAVDRGPAQRARAASALFEALADHYGIQDTHGARDLGGSQNLNLLVRGEAERVVVRVYRPWLTTARLAAIQAARRHLTNGSVPCPLPIRTRDGATWIRVGDRLVEVEPYVPHAAAMDTWDRLAAGLPMLGRIHALLRTLEVSEDGRHAPASNAIASDDALAGTLRGLRRLRAWNPSPAELQLATEAEELANLVDRAEREIDPFPRQLVHGDFWDNNVLLRDGRIVMVGDLDFMGERPRIDDLALTLYYTNSTFHDDQGSDDRIRRLHSLVDAYDRGLDEPLSTAERAALPLALARAPLCFIAMIARVDSETGARTLAAEMAPDVAWALAIARDLDHWQRVFL